MLSKCRHVSLSALQWIMDAGLSDEGMLCMSQIIAPQLQQWGATLSSRHLWLSLPCRTLGRPTHTALFHSTHLQQRVLQRDNPTTHAECKHRSMPGVKSQQRKRAVTQPVCKSVAKKVFRHLNHTQKCINVSVFEIKHQIKWHLFEKTNKHTVQAKHFTIQSEHRDTEVTTRAVLLAFLVFTIDILLRQKTWRT